MRQRTKREVTVHCAQPTRAGIQEVAASVAMSDLGTFIHRTMPEKSGLLATVSGITIIRSQDSTFTILCSHHQEMTEVTRSSPRLSLLVLFWLKEIILTPHLKESPRTPTGHLSGESVPGAS